MADGAALSIRPAESSAESGEVVNVDVVLDAGAQPVDALAAHLDFDPRLLAVVDQAGVPADRIQPGTVHDNLANDVDNTLGTIDYAIVCSDTPPLEGATTVATIRFIVKADAYGDAWVRFNTSGPRETGAFYEGDTVLGQLAAGRIALPPMPFALHFPMILKK